MSGEAVIAQEVMKILDEVLSHQLGSPTATDQNRVAAFVEAIEAGDIELVSPGASEEEIAAWASKLKDDQTTMGEPVSTIAISGMITFAFIIATIQDPEFLPKVLKEVGNVVEKVGNATRKILDSKQGKAFLQILSKIIS
jgi:hypothetical protein